MLEDKCESHSIWHIKSRFSGFNLMLQNHVVEIERQFVDKKIDDSWVTLVTFSNTSTPWKLEV